MSWDEEADSGGRVTRNEENAQSMRGASRDVEPCLTEMVLHNTAKPHLPSSVSYFSVRPAITFFNDLAANGQTNYAFDEFLTDACLYCGNTT